MRTFLRKPSDTEQRPKIHTFICVDECEVINSLDDAFILEWAEVWFKAGWDPIVLTEKDARHHPKYNQYIKQLTEAKVPSIRWNRYLRYLAMSTHGGWYADPSLIPIVSSDVFKALPNNGKFTMHDERFPHLLSGNKEAWELFSNQMIDDLEIKNDAVLISMFIQNNPDRYFKENSMIHAVDILYTNLNSVDCTILNNKLVTSVPEEAQRTKIDYFHSIHTALEKCQSPVIYTFFEMAHDEKGSHEMDAMDVEQWKSAWMEAGWHPVILNLDDAKKHPGFSDFQGVVNDSAMKGIEYEQMCYYRWLAVAAAGGGWMADIDTYPLHIDPKIYGKSLPGKFTSHCWKAPCLVSGSESEWNRVIPLLLESLTSHKDMRWSDMFAMQDVIDKGEINMEMGHGELVSEFTNIKFSG